MERPMAKDMDYLAARLHGRRSRLAEAERLDPLCRLRTIADLGHAIFPAVEVRTVADFQRRLLAELIREVTELINGRTAPEKDLLTWMLTRFQVENLKVLIRGLVTRTPVAELSPHLIPLPAVVGFDLTPLMDADTLEDLSQRLPAGGVRDSLQDALVRYRDQSGSFFHEAAVDGGYYRELLARLTKLTGEDRAAIQAMVRQEVDGFHLTLVARGRFLDGLKPDLLLPLHVAGASITQKQFAGMLRCPDLATAVGRVLGRTQDPAVVEALIWNRYLRLANRAFRRSRMGFGVVAGYSGIRRVEVANLITLSEGIRAGLASEPIRARMVPRLDLEVLHV